MLDIALRHKPNAACIVPEKRQEVTTEGGLDVAGGLDGLRPYCERLAGAGIRVSLFIDPDIAQLEAAAALKAPIVELHTGAYCEAFLDDRVGARTQAELARIAAAAEACAELGLECHAGHGLTFDTVASVAVMPQVMELNIGHFLIGEAIFCGLDASIRRMRSLMDQARAEAGGARSA
jgi:pyridoxine 5-phosphate synthase